MRKLKAKSQGNTSYTIGAHTIMLPADHNLPTFQVTHRLYDRFLPVLCAALPQDGVIVDVGANVGDTVAAMMSAGQNPIVAIEGHRPYFDLLCANLAHIDPTHRVTPIHTLVGTGAMRGELTPVKGTARLTALAPGNADLAPMRTLDDLLREQGGTIALIKVDTDGFDADVLLSGLATIQAARPLLYWEGGTTDATNFAGMYDAIAAAGYEYVWIFDNYGNLIISEASLAALRDFDRYIVSQYRHGCTRTMYYVDVLASTAATLSTARSAIAAYRRDVVEACADELAL